MKKSSRPDRTPRFAIPALLALLTTFTGVGGLKNVWLKAPIAVAPGQSATLICNYDLEGDPLYTVKWYKGRQEFFRYVPKEHPHTRVFLQPGINVDVGSSGPDRVVIREVTEHLGGKYRCEVSADAPNFHTVVVSAYMHVVHMPEGRPVLRLEKSRYSLGDVIKGNCTSPPSNPPANITWVINGNYVNSSSISRTPVGNKYETQAILEHELNSHALGKIKVVCIADVFKVYVSEAEQLLDEEKPQIASVLGGGSMRLESTVKALLAACLLLLLALNR